MNPKIAADVEKFVQAVRTFCGGKDFTSYRLIQYCGPEKLDAFDIEPSEVELRVEVAINEGFNAMWAERDKQFILCIRESWEEPATPPAWERVYAEHDLD